MRMPNFLIIGAGRSGTTSLYRYVRQHPEVYMSPVKEPNFFSWDGVSPIFRGPGDRLHLSLVRDIQHYRKLFEGATNEKALGEASPSYLYRARAIERIKHHIPNARLIAILRHPAERAYSQYLGMAACGREQLSFPQAIRAEEDRIRRNWEGDWHYVRPGFYAAQLKRYYQVFDRKQIRVYLYEDLKSEPVRLMQDVFSFLGVDDTFIPDTSIRHNPSGIPKNKVLSAFLVFLGRNPIRPLLKPFFPARLRERINDHVAGFFARNLVKPPLPLPIRTQLVEVYREDILRLQELISRDLSKWLE